MRSIIYTVISGLFISWIIGFIHSYLIEELPNIQDNAFYRRLGIYMGVLVATWLVYKEVRPISEAISFRTITIVCITSLAITYCIIVIMFSYIELYSRVNYPASSVRLYVNDNVLYPILLSSLYLFWVPIATLWYVLTTAYTQKL